MASYYFSADGLAANNGTSSGTPKPLSALAAMTFAANDIILLRSGDTFILPGGFSFDPAKISPAPTVGNPLTIRIYGGTARARIITPGGSGILFYNIGGIEIEDVDFYGDRINAGYLGYLDTALTYPAMKLTRCSFRNYVEGASVGKGGQAGKWVGCRYTDVDFSDNLRNGHSSYKGGGSATNWTYDDLQLIRCTAFRNYGDPSQTTVNSGSGIIVGCANNALIDQCGAGFNGGNGANSTGGPGAIWTWASNAVTIQRSVAYSTRRGAVEINDGGAFDIDIDCTNCTSQYNLSFDNEGSGQLLYNGTAGGSSITATGNVIRFNVSINDAARYSAAGFNGGLQVVGALTGCSVYGNTFIVSDPNNAAGFFASGSVWSGVKVANNIFEHRGGGKALSLLGTRAVGEAIFQGNDYWSSAGNAQITWNAVTHTTLAAFRAAATGQELVSAVNSGFSVASGIAQGPTTDALALDYALVADLPSGSTLGATNAVYSAIGITPGSRDFGNEALRATTSVGAVQVPLLSLNTAQNPNLAQLLVATQDGLVDYATDKGGGAAATYSGRKKDALKALKNASGQPYVTET